MNKCSTLHKKCVKKWNITETDLTDRYELDNFPFVPEFNGFREIYSSAADSIGNSDLLLSFCFLRQLWYLFSNYFICFTKSDMLLTLLSGFPAVVAMYPSLLLITVTNFWTEKVMSRLKILKHGFRSSIFHFRIYLLYYLLNIALLPT